jgi:hypothetical protein
VVGRCAASREWSVEAGIGFGRLPVPGRTGAISREDGGTSGPQATRRRPVLLTRRAGRRSREAFRHGARSRIRYRC